MRTPPPQLTTIHLTTTLLTTIHLTTPVAILGAREVEATAPREAMAPAEVMAPKEAPAGAKGATALAQGNTLKHEQSPNP